jgi:hypothetical protein
LSGKAEATIRFSAAKKRGGTNPASPNGNANALPLVFYRVKKAAQGGFSANSANESPYLISF